MSRLRSLRNAVGRKVRVNLPDVSVEGVLTHVSRHVLIVSAATIPQAGRNPDLVLEGEQVFDRPNISFVQVLPL